MNSDFLIHLASALAIGFVTGLFSGAFGIGGGTVSTPMLRLFLGINPHVAVGTTMALIIPTSMSGTFNYFRRNEIDREIGSMLILPAVTGVLFGAAVTDFVNGLFLMLLFAVFVAISGVDLSLGIVHKLMKRYREDHPLNPSRRRHKFKILAVGLFTGFFAGFFGVGGGFIMVPCMLYFFNMPIKTAFGTSLLVVSALAIPGTITHAIMRHVDLPLMLSMMFGSIPGSFLGSALSLKLKDSWLRRGFGVIMLVVAAGLVLRELMDSGIIVIGGQKG